MNFNKSTVGLNFFLIIDVLAKFQNNLRLITISLIKHKNYKFLYLRLCIKEMGF